MKFRQMVLLIAVLSLVGATAASAGVVRHESNVKITNINYSYGHYIVRGRVTSPKPACIRNRLVTVQTHNGEAWADFPDFEPPAGSTTTTDSEGRWVYRGTQVEGFTDFRAKVARKTLANGDICKADTSETYTMSWG